MVAANVTDEDPVKEIRHGGVDGRLDAVGRGGDGHRREGGIASSDRRDWKGSGDRSGDGSGGKIQDGGHLLIVLRRNGDNGGVDLRGHDDGL